MKKIDAMECARTFLDTVPVMMRRIVSEIHRQRSNELSMIQFGTMMFINDHEGISLSVVARHHGATLSSTSRLIDGLVEKGYILRETPKNDRRKVQLSLTDEGKTSIKLMHQTAINYLAKMLHGLSEEDLEMIVKSVKLLDSVVVGNAEPEIGP